MNPIVITNRIQTIAIATLLASSAHATPALAQSFPQPESSNTCVQALQLANKVDGKIEVTELLRYRVHSVDICTREFGEDHQYSLISMSNLGDTYGALGQYEKALVLYEKIVPLMQIKLGEYHADTLIVTEKLGGAYYALDQNEKALLIFENALPFMQTKLGVGHLTTLSSMTTLGHTYHAVGQLEKALALYENTLPLVQAKFGRNHLFPLNTMLNIGKTYGDLGQHQKALKLNEQTLASMQSLLGLDHLRTLICMRNLATNYSALGQHEKALELNEKNVSLRTSKQGVDHSDTLKSMDNLVNTYRALGLRNKALALNEKILALTISKLGPEHQAALSSMSNLALTHSDLGEYEKALLLNEKAVALMQVKLGSAHANTLISMSNLASTYSSLGQYEKERLWYEKILTLRQAKLGEDHPDTLNAMFNLAKAYNSLGQYDSALIYYEKAIPLMQITLGFANRATLASRGNRAGIYEKKGDAKKALDERYEVFNIVKKIPNYDASEVLRAAINLSSSLLSVNRTKEAEQLLDEVVASEIKNNNVSEELYSAMQNLVVIKSRTNDIQSAINISNELFEKRQIFNGIDHHLTARAGNTLAALHIQNGEYTKGIDILKILMHSGIKMYGADHEVSILSRTNLIEAYDQIHDEKNALQLISDFVTGNSKNDSNILVKNFIDKYSNFKIGQSHKSIKLLSTEDYSKYTVEQFSQLATVVGSVFSDNGVPIVLNDLVNGTLALEKALPFAKSILGESHINTLRIQGQLGLIYAGAADGPELAPAVLKSVREKSDSDPKLFPLYVSSSLGLLEMYVRVKQNAKALVYIDEIVEKIEKLRQNEGLVIDQRQVFFEKYADQYKYFSYLLALDKNINKAFALGDQSKARTLADTIKTQSAMRSLPAAQQADVQALQARAQLQAAALDKLQNRGAVNTGQLLMLKKSIDEVSAEYLSLTARLKALYPKYASLSELPPASASLAPQLLGDKEIFVSYLLRPTGQAQVFLLPKSGQPQWVDLGNIHNHAQTVAAYRELIAPSSRASEQGQLIALKDGGYQWLPAGSELPKNAANPAVKSPAAASPAAALVVLKQYWHNTLIKPLLPFASGYERWIISPDKDLALLPFDTVPYSDPSAATDASKPPLSLAQAKQTTLVQSFAVYALLKAREVEYAMLPRAKELFAMGNAVYNDDWQAMNNQGANLPAPANAVAVKPVRKRQTTAHESTADKPVTSVNVPMTLAGEQYSQAQLWWSNLPGTAREVQAVAQAFGVSQTAQAKGNNGGLVDIFMGAQANEAVLQQMNLEGKLKDYRYMLFSAHGYLAQNPALSALVLSQKGNPAGVDGYVTAAEWPLYDLRSDLTVLSACDTGVGSTQSGEGVMGLPYALFVAGNKNTLLSLWPVDDDATAEFMRQFFTQLRAGVSQPQALAQTKQAFMQHPRWSAPRYWAAFVLYGV